MLNEFLKFIQRGRVVDLAVAVVIGAAFSKVVNSLVDDVINPIISAIFGYPDLSALTISIGDAEIRYGSLLNAIINFLLVALAVFFLVVKPVEKMNSLQAAKEKLPEMKTCRECLSEIPAGASRCKNCGQLQA